jgi:hypothetical protein
MSRTRPPILIPALCVAVGVLLLLNNFLLLEGVTLSAYWPILLIGVGVLILLNGDLILTRQSGNFGITRGAVESATLEAASGELDIQLRALRREGRLIAGNYTARSRPVLGTLQNGKQARVMMQRGQTWLLSQADWEVEITPDVPWSVMLTSWIGDMTVDLTDLTIERAHLGTGFGEIQVTAPATAPQGLALRSTFGNIGLELPKEAAAIIVAKPGRFGRLLIDESRYLMVEPGIYATLNYREHPAPMRIRVTSTFGTMRIV